jgi:predicted enzyme related to lactoylglutathione lyase
MTYSGMTLQVQVGDIREAAAFYTGLFGHGPDFAPHDDFLEWHVFEGLWIQVVGVTGTVRPLLNRVRFGVDDIHDAVARARAELGADPAPVSSLPGVVSFTDFDDPWGNRLGFYQEIFDGEPATPGGSVHDESLFETESD